MDRREELKQKITRHIADSNIDGYSVVPTITKYDTKGKCTPVYIGVNEEWVKLTSACYLGHFSSREEYSVKFIIEDRIYEKKLFLNTLYNTWYLQDNN